MIKIIYTTILLFTFLAVDCQIDVKKMLKKKSEDKAEKEVDKKIDQGFNKVEAIFKKDNTEAGKESKKTDSQTSTETTSESSTIANMETSENNKPTLNWSKYDFVPGDNVIFEDNLVNEENGEFPSRWDLAGGVVEVAEFGGNNVIMFRGGSPTIIPYLENSDKDYLPDVFTTEFDVYMGGTSGWITMYLWDRKNQKKPAGSQTSLDVHYNKMSIYSSQSTYPDKTLERNRWIHVSVAYTKNKFKAYLDDTRLINIPRLDADPSGISLHCYHANDNNPIYVRNFRIAEGGVKYYDRMLQDGKIIANGIRFDVGKATIRPESMGIINEIFELMSDHPEIKFSVEGHTDSDGNNDYNMNLSEQRAKAVAEKLTEMGISKDRLQFKGFGETVPVAENTTAEGKANNRRVEFIKI